MLHFMHINSKLVSNESLDLSPHYRNNVRLKLECWASQLRPREVRVLFLHISIIPIPLWRTDKLWFLLPVSQPYLPPQHVQVQELFTIDGLLKPSYWLFLVSTRILRLRDHVERWTHPRLWSQMDRPDLDVYDKSLYTIIQRNPEFNTIHTQGE